MRRIWTAIIFLIAVAWVAPLRAGEVPPGLPPVPIPADNPQSPEKIALGKRGRTPLESIQECLK